MCINPNWIWIKRGSGWEKLPRPCRDCWRCKQNRQNDYVGRAMAEAYTSRASCALNLTYAPRDDLYDKILHPPHFQNFMKLLRHAGHKVRYLVAGEYGDLKSRAHFHVLLFFTHIAPGSTGITPDGEVVSWVPEYNPAHVHDPRRSAPFNHLTPHKRMVHIREWPHGHVTCDWSASESSARYVTKYLLDDDKNNAWFSLSKKPALGAAWFAQKAAQAVEFGVLPSSFNYLPPGGSKDRPYLLTGASRRDYMNAITTDPVDRDRMAEWTQKAFDKYHQDRLKTFWDTEFPENWETALEDRLYLVNRETDIPARLELYVEFLRDFAQKRGATPLTEQERLDHGSFAQKVAEIYTTFGEYDYHSGTEPRHFRGGSGKSDPSGNAPEHHLSTTSRKICRIIEKAWEGGALEPADYWRVQDAYAYQGEPPSQSDEGSSNGEL